MKYLPLIIISFLLMACKNPKKQKSDKKVMSATEKMMAISSQEEAYYFFRDKGKFQKVKNCSLQFGTASLDSSLLVNHLCFEQSEFPEGNEAFFRKGAFKFFSPFYQDTLMMFKYGVIEDSTVKALRFRCLKDSVVLFDSTLMSFNHPDAIDYDYMILGDNPQTIMVLAKNEGKSSHNTHYVIDSGNIRRISFFPDTFFVKPQIFPKTCDKVLLYNQFPEKTLNNDSGNSGRVEATLIKGYGCKGYGWHYLLKVEDSSLLGSHYVSLPFGNPRGHWWNEHGYQTPMKLKILESDSLINDDLGFGPGKLPLKDSKVFLRNVFVEPLLD